MRDEVIEKILDDRVYQRFTDDIHEKYTMFCMAEKNPINTTVLGIGVMRKLIDPDKILFYIIKNVKDVQQLFLIGTILRLGADPNCYINGSHILCWAYVYLMFNQRLEILKYIYLFLTASGCSIEYETKTDLPQKTVKLVKEKTLNAERMVIKDWIISKGYKIFSTEEVTDFDFFNIVLDRVPYDMEFIYMAEKSYMFGKEGTIKFAQHLLELILNCVSYNILSSINEINPKTINQLEFGESLIVNSIIDSANPTFFEIAMMKGIPITYFSIVRIIMLLPSKYGRLYKKMLLAGIKNGIYFDMYMLKQVEQILPLIKDSAVVIDPMSGENLLDNIRREYNVPHYKKICSNPELNKREIKAIAYKLELDLNAPADVLCEKIKEITKLDTEILFSLYGERECKNKLKNVYSNTQIVSYVDKNEKRWCIPSDLFRKCIETKLNPFNNKHLPKEIIKVMKEQLEIFEMIGMDLSPIEAKEADEINNQISDDICKIVLKSFQIAKKDISKITIDSMSKILIKLGFRNNILNGLNDSLAFVIFCRGVYARALEDKEIYYKIISI